MLDTAHMVRGRRIALESLHGVDHLHMTGPHYRILAARGGGVIIIGVHAALDHLRLDFAHELDVVVRVLANLDIVNAQLLLGRVDAES